jgi:tRNA nucleotidyltransferase/poly(A) polymerase
MLLIFRIARATSHDDFEHDDDVADAIKRAQEIAEKTREEERATLQRQEQERVQQEEHARLVARRAKEQAKERKEAMLLEERARYVKSLLYMVVVLVVYLPVPTTL